MNFPKNKKILLGDDDRNITSLVKTCLEKFDCIVTVTHDGKSAIEEALINKPDLIILDISFLFPPNGIETCRTLKNNHKTAKIPVIMLTSSEYAEDIEECFKCGASDYCFKPFNPTELLQKVCNLLQ